MSVTIANEIPELYQEIKRGKKYRWMLFKLTENEKEIVVDKTGEVSSTYESFVSSLPSQEPRWGLINFEYRTQRGPSSKLLFVLWVPDAITRHTLKEAARVKSNGVMFSSLFKSMFKEVVGTVQANDLGDIEWINVLGKASRFERDPVDMDWRPPQDL